MSKKKKTTPPIATLKPNSTPITRECQNSTNVSLPAKNLRVCQESYNSIGTSLADDVKKEKVATNK